MNIQIAYFIGKTCDWCGRKYDYTDGWGLLNTPDKCIAACPDHENELKEQLQKEYKDTLKQLQKMLNKISEED